MPKFWVQIKPIGGPKCGGTPLYSQVSHRQVTVPSVCETGCPAALIDPNVRMISSLWDEISANSIKLHGQHLSRRRIRLKVRTSRTGTFPLRSKSLRPIPPAVRERASRRWWEERRLWVAGSARSVSRSVPFSHEYQSGEWLITAPSETEPVPKYTKSSRSEQNSTLLNTELHFCFLWLLFVFSPLRSAPLRYQGWITTGSSSHTARPGSHNTLLETPLQWEPSFPVPLSE